jgi:hypothetical protein
MLMLHLNTIDPPLYKVLLDFCHFPAMSGFSLVGGTALSLQVGHRKSDDLDFFTDRSFDLRELKHEIGTKRIRGKVATQTVSNYGTI